MFPYFGKKSRFANRYPIPLYPLIIEPFAGSMAYTLYHRPEMAIGIEADKRVVELWHYGSSLESIPPAPSVGNKTNDLLVKLCSYSEHSLTTAGPMTVTSRMIRDWNPVHTKMIEAGKWCREHVIYRHGDYSNSPDLEATWFIDPPYQHANRRGYKHSSAGIDFDELAKFAMARKGQVIVCEQEGANWLPFKPLYDLQSHRGSKATEMIWSTP